METPEQFDLQIDGENIPVTVEPDMPLLWLLRDQLGRCETKFGCGIAHCGACTIHLDGIAVRSCVTPVKAARNKVITTLRGLGGDHPVQQAWEKYQVPQCGYCQPGQIMQACALLKAKPDPSDADIDRAMAGNLCRCGTYPRIKAAIRSLAGRGV
jgi:isoquinoline 1-oxidoreductase alpha subunit